MITLIIILLILQAINNGLIIYLLFKKESGSERHEPLVKIFTPKGSVMDWQPPKQEEEKAEEQIRKDLNL